MHIYILYRYVCICLYVRVCVRIWICIRVRVRIRMGMRIRIYICNMNMFMCMHIYMHMHMYMCTYMCLCIRVFTYIVLSRVTHLLLWIKWRWHLCSRTCVRVSACVCKFISAYRHRHRRRHELRCRQHDLHGHMYVWVCKSRMQENLTKKGCVPVATTGNELRHQACLPPFRAKTFPFDK